MAEVPDVKKLNGLASAAQHARMPYEKDWWLNLAFNQGEQYSEWHAPIQNIRRIPWPTDQDGNEIRSPRATINKIGHFVEQQHGFALQSKPVPDVLPSNDDLIALSNAQVALAYCNYIASPEVTGFPATLSRSVLWALICGTSYLKWVWDPVLKRPSIICVNPFELLVDPYAQEWSAVRYVIHQKFMDPEMVYDLWGKTLKVNTERVDSTRASMLREMGAAPAVEGVTVNELWMKPSRRFPEGMYSVWCQNELIISPDKLPYKHLRKERKLPFTPLGVVPRQGSPYYDSHVKRLRPAQMELNKFHSQVIQIRENFANPKWTIPEEIDLQQDPNDFYAQILRYSGESGLKPEIIQATGMVSGNDGEWLTEEMMNVVGLHEVSQAQVPGRVESAKAIEMLKEADASRLAELLHTMSDAIAEGYWHVLMLAKEKENPRKLVAVYSEDGFAEVREFRARQVDPGIRFKVTMGTGLGWTRAGRQDTLIELYNLGIFQDDPQRFLNLLDIGGNLPLNAKAQDVRLARNENYRMAHKEAITANSWDDHEIHLREHNTYRKSYEFETLPTRAKIIFEFHCQAHERLEIQQLNKLAIKQAVAQGAMIGQDGGAGPDQDSTPQTPPGQAAAEPADAPAEQPNGQGP